jgi:transketolase C-terminal domain/subunit
MDKKMHNITKDIEKAEKDIKEKKPKKASKVLKKAAKKNEKLVRVDRDLRDPMIDKAKKMQKRFPQDWSKVK